MGNPRISAATELLVQATTKEVVTAFDAAGVRHILLKGPLLRRWLFPDGDQHVSADVDVLVAPDAWPRAEEELAQLGFEPLLLDIIPGDRPNHARPYAHARGGPSVDVHRTLLGAEAKARIVWDSLQRETDNAMLGVTTITVLNPAGQLMHVALHAALHHSDGQWVAAIVGAQDRPAEVGDAAHGVGGEGHQVLRIEKAEVALLDAEDLEAAVERGEGDRAQHGVQPGCVAPAGVDRDPKPARHGANDNRRWAFRRPRCPSRRREGERAERNVKMSQAIRFRGARLPAAPVGASERRVTPRRAGGPLPALPGDVAAVD